jgi:hypothetical protein
VLAAGLQLAQLGVAVHRPVARDLDEPCDLPGWRSAKPGAATAEQTRRAPSPDPTSSSPGVSSRMISGEVETCVAPPAEVTTSTSLSTSAGALSANSSAMNPPMETPTSDARSMPSSCARPATSSARSPIVYGPSAESESPTSR